MGEMINIIVTSIVASIVATSLSYLKEKKFATSVYTEKVFVELYSPLFRKLEDFSMDPRIGYEGMDLQQFREVSNLINNKLEYADKKLLDIISEIEIIVYYLHDQLIDDETKFLLDDKFILYNHVSKDYNILRRSLGLPFDRFQIYKGAWVVRKYTNLRNERLFKKMMKNHRSNKSN